MLTKIKDLNKFCSKASKKNIKTLQEQRLLRFYGLYKRYIEHKGTIAEKYMRPHSTFKTLRVLKSRCRAISLKSSANFFCAQPLPYAFFIGSERCVFVCTNGQIFVFNKDKFINALEFKIDGHNIFNGSLVVNSPQRSVVLNKKFTITFSLNKNCFFARSSHPFDGGGVCTFVLSLGENITQLSPVENANLNRVMLAACRQKTRSSGKSENFLFEVKTISDYARFLGLKNAAKTAQRFCADVQIGGVFLSKFKYKKLSTQPSITSGTPISMQMRYLPFFNASKFYIESGTYNIIKKDGLLKIGINGILFYAKGSIKNFYLNGHEIICHGLTHFECNGVKFFDTVRPLEYAREITYGFFFQKEFNEHAKNSLKKILVQKCCLKEAARHLLKIGAAAKTQAEQMRLYKLAALILSLPERKGKTKTITEILLEQQKAAAFQNHLPYIKQTC